MISTLMLAAALSFAPEVDLDPDEAAVLEALEVKDPQLVETLLELRSTQPATYRAKLHHFAQMQRKSAHAADLQRNPEILRAKVALHETEAQLSAQFEALAQARDVEERAQIELELRSLAQVLFAQKAELKRVHLAHQQAELDAARAELEAFEAELEPEADAWLDRKLDAMGPR